MDHMNDPAQAEIHPAAQMLLQILAAASSAGCSDVHIRAGSPPFGRVDGKLFRMEGKPLTAAEILQMIEITSKRELGKITGSSFEYSFEQSGAARYRGHAFRHGGGWALALRAVPLKVPSFQELRLPAVVKTISSASPGLVLVAGPTGSGKSTTCASMIDYIAQNELCHIVTVEDPIEYRVQVAQSCVTQREVGRDTPDYTTGLEAALREDPDVIFVGEIRDQATLEVALHAADTGHTVISTYHTRSAQQTIGRLIGSFPPDAQASVRDRLADSLNIIICQRLLVSQKVRGRVLATEVLVNNYAVRDAIRDPAKHRGLTQILERSNDQNMHSFDQSLATLVNARIVSPEVALAHAASPNNLRRAFTGVAA